MGKDGAPVIIKRIGAPAAAGHHGGAWKVAYADFVTAMMAFFLLMWLLNATTEKQRQGLADYFDPTIVNSPSSGGDGVDGGQAQAPANGQDQATAATDRAESFEEMARRIQDELTGTGAESMQRVNLLRHVVTRVTDEGLVIELGDIAGEPLFAEDTAEPAPVLRDLTAILATVLGRVRNQVAVAGHVRGYPEMLVENPVWPLSDARAQAVRGLLDKGGLGAGRVQRVTAFGDRRPRSANPMDPANNRIEVILLR